MCVGGAGSVLPEHSCLSVFEKRLLDDAGVDVSFPPSKKRRMGERAGLHYDTWL